MVLSVATSGGLTLIDRIPVVVHASDPISQAGIASQLRARPEILVVEDSASEEPTVGIVVADEIDDEVLRVIKKLQRCACRSVLVLHRVDDSGLLLAVEAGTFALVRRSEATPETLMDAVRSAAGGDATLPPDLLGRLLERVGQLQRHVLAPRGLDHNGLTRREVIVLKLVAEGLSTREIARQVSYSERTIKNIIHDVNTKLRLRNRSHAVAYATREGLI